MPDDDDELFSTIGDLPSSGISSWAVSEPYCNLWIFGQPLTYYMNHRRPVGLSLAWKHRNSRPTSGAFGFGPGWECSWLTYLDAPTTNQAKAYVPLGGARTYTLNGTTKEFKSGTTMSCSFHDYVGWRWTINHPSGAKDVYENAFRIQEIDPQGRTNRFNYSGSRLTSMVDADGKTNTITYDSTFPMLVSKVTDPYGRSASFVYDGSGRLITITNLVAAHGLGWDDHLDNG